MQVAANCYARRRVSENLIPQTPNPQTGSTDISNTHSIRFDSIQQTCVFGIASHTSSQTENESADKAPKNCEVLESKTKPKW